MFSSKEQALSTSELKIPVHTLSQIGASHVRQNKPNQDYGKCDFLKFGDETLYILSVSDGHGSERSFRSDQGSRIAVESTIKVLKEIFFKNLSVSELKTQSDFIIGRIIHYWKQEVKQHFYDNTLAESEAVFFDEQNYTEEQMAENIERAYGATLILAVITPNYVLYLQIGDGNIYAIEASGKPSIPFQPDSTIIGNDTHSLCEKDVRKHIQIKIVPHDDLPNFVFLTTDGLPNSFATDDEFSSAVEGIYKTICEYGLEIVCEEIPRWLQEYTEQGSGDDITVAFYCKEGVKINDETKVVEEENQDSLPKNFYKVTEEGTSESTHEITYEVEEECKLESTTQEVISEVEGGDVLESTAQEIVSEVDREDILESTQKVTSKVNEVDILESNSQKTVSEVFRDDISKVAEEVTSQVDKQAILDSSDKTTHGTSEQSVSESMQHDSLESNKTVHSEVSINDSESPKKNKLSNFFKFLR